jgi:NADH-quinone oxidoreductase subunit B
MGVGQPQKTGNPGVVATTLEEMVNWARTGAMWPLGFGLACCAIEMMSTQASVYDLSRFGMELMRPSPRQADMIIVAGRVTRKRPPSCAACTTRCRSKWGGCADCRLSGLGVHTKSPWLQGVDGSCRWTSTWRLPRRARTAHPRILPAREGAQRELQHSA